MPGEMMRSRSALLALLALIACEKARSPAPEHSVVAPRAPVVSQRACRAPLGGLRIGSDSVAGLSMRASFRELRQVCRSTLDSVAPGGYQALALRFDFPGGQIWAVSGADAYGGRIPEDSAPEDWWARGDSLRFQTGGLIPQSVGALLAADSDAVLRAEGRDDTEGSYIIPCRFPRMSFVLGYLSSLPDTGAWPLSDRRVPDNLRIERVTIDTSHALDPAIPRLCRVPRVTNRDSTHSDVGFSGTRTTMPPANVWASTVAVPVPKTTVKRPRRWPS